MSMECRECEHDLRGDHADDCSANERAPWRLHENHEIEAAAQSASKRALFTTASDVRYGFFEGYDFAARAAQSQPTVTTEDIGKVVWETSRADEGSISATGANIIANELLAKFNVTRTEIGE